MEKKRPFQHASPSTVKNADTSMVRAAMLTRNRLSGLLEQLGHFGLCLKLVA